MLKSLAIICTLWIPTASPAETYMLMAEERGCYWCARWNEDIGHIYPKTEFGETAPLRRYDLHADTPEVAFARRVTFTPTFILVEDNEEIGRIEGYPGEAFFWALLGTLFSNAKIPLDQTG